MFLLVILVRGHMRHNAATSRENELSELSEHNMSATSQLTTTSKNMKGRRQVEDHLFLVNESRVAIIFRGMCVSCKVSEGRVAIISREVRSSSHAQTGHEILLSVWSVLSCIDADRSNSFESAHRDPPTKEST